MIIETPKRVTVKGTVKTLKIKAVNGKKQGEAILHLASGKEVKANLKGAMLDAILRIGKNTPVLMAVDKIKGQTPWLVAIRKTA